jgi:hypothetical protein
VTESHPKTPEHKPPSQLYKYRSLASPGLSEIFTRSVVWFARPDSFNDPFDCRVRIVYDRSPEELDRYWDQMLAKYHPGLTREEGRAWKQRAIAAGNRESYMDTHMQKEVDGLGVYSVSATPSHPLLWSHYADGHKGLCLRFEHMVGLFPELRLRGAQHVRYSERYPLTSEKAEPWEQVEATILTKAGGWSYEEESRFLDVENGPGLRRFNPGYLSGVIFGCRMAEEDRRRIREWVAVGQTRPEFLQATIRKGEFALDIVPAE